MAEVQRRLETITVELEELTQVGFFTDAECTALVKKQFEFENKINSMNKSLQDFRDYIAYLVALYRMIKVRRNKLRLNEKKHNLEYRVLQRIKNLYEMAATRFVQHVDLYFEFFQFCKEASFEHATTKMCNMMIKFHQSNEEVWLTAARLYFHERKDALKAIKLLQQGIGVLHSSALYTECIHYEIYADVKRFESAQTNYEDYKSEIITNLVKKVEIYINQAKQHIEDYRFYTNLLDFLVSFEFSGDLQIKILDLLLMENYSNIPESWEFLASREFNGLHYDCEDKELVSVTKTKGFINAIAIYEKGLNNIYFENRQKLWTFYLKFLIDFKSNDDFENITNYPNLALGAFQRAASENCLIDQYYLHYIDLVNDNKKISILKEANLKQPLSIDLWKLRMQIEIAKNVHEDISATFKSAYESLGQEAGEIWNIMHNFLESDKNRNDEDIKKFFNLAIEQNGSISDDYMPKYIQWLATTNMDECRRVYELLSESKPFNEKMYKTMLEIEAKTENKSTNLNRLEVIHKAACRKVGSDIVDVWMYYIKFLIDVHKLNGAKNIISKVVLEARKKLSGELHGEFEEKYDKVMKLGLKRKLSQ